MIFKNNLSNLFTRPTLSKIFAIVLQTPHDTLSSVGDCYTVLINVPAATSFIRMRNTSVRIGCGQGFWGDWLEGPRLLVEKGNLDYLILDYLAEVTMSVLAKQKARKPEYGFGRDLPQLIKTVAAPILSGALKVVTNGGGLNPRACAESVIAMFREAFPDQPPPKVAFVEGDDLVPHLSSLRNNGESFAHLESGRAFEEVEQNIVSLNAYTDCSGVVAALQAGAQIVVTGRVADPALCLGPLMHEFGWSRDNFDLLASGIIAGHIIECGSQSTGGNFSLGWPTVPDPSEIGYPIVEVSVDGSFIVTKPNGSGGVVSIASVTEQLVYEIGDPENYITPDVVADFTSLSLSQIETNKVKVTGARGKAAPATLKVSGTYVDGYKAEGTLVLVGPHVTRKAAICREMIEKRLAIASLHLQELLFENLGTFACIPGMSEKGLYPEPGEVVFRVAARDQDQKKLERFTREIAPLVLSGPSGITGYAGGKGDVKEVVSFWPCLVNKAHVSQQWGIVND